ncbi:MAG: hypothetical protein LBP62_02580 [Clostridiales bacterium]|nr:hypothetical protein [Clostridiales bacterium]
MRIIGSGRPTPLPPPTEGNCGKECLNFSLRVTFYCLILREYGIIF